MTTLRCAALAIAPALVACTTTTQEVVLRDPADVAVYDRRGEIAARPHEPVDTSVPGEGSHARVSLRRSATGALSLGEDVVIDEHGRFLLQTPGSWNDFPSPRLDGDALRFTYPLMTGVGKGRGEASRIQLAAPRENVVTAREVKTPVFDGLGFFVGGAFLLGFGIPTLVILTDKGLSTEERTTFGVAFGASALAIGIPWIVRDIYGLVAKPTETTIYDGSAPRAP